AFGIPEVEPTGGEMNPSGLNNWDAAENTLYLAQVVTAGTSSTGKITVTSVGGSKIVIPANSDITVDPVSSEHATQEYTFKWEATTAADLAEKEIAVNVLNNSDHTKIGNIKVKLLPNRINNLQLTTAPSDIKLSDITTTTASLTVPIIKDKQFTITMDNYNKPTLSKCPTWLTDITPAATRSTPESKTASFTFKLNENATNFDDTKLVFANASGGKEMTVNIARQFQAPTITATPVSVGPSLNSYSGGKLNMYQLKSDYYSTVTLKVYSLGGSILEFPANVSADLTQSTAKEKNYTIRYKASSFSTTDVNGGTLYIKNLSDETKKQSIPVTFKSSLPKVTSNRDGKGISCTQYSSDVDVYVRDDWGTYGETGFVFTFISPVGYNFSSISTGGNANTRTTISTGSQSGSTGNISNTFTLSFNSSTTLSNSTNLYYYSFTAKDTRFPDYMIDLYMYMPVYKGKTPYKMGGLYAMPNIRGTWYNAVDAGNNAGSGWRLASMEDYRKLVGWGGDSDYANFDNITVRTLKTSTTYIDRIFTTGDGENEGRHFASNTDYPLQDHARTMDIYTTSTGRYGYPSKGSNFRYVLVHD
ncbi:MAG: hypothetical protein LUF01_00810, partial [Bacteroides sp.]|nr:hypothetical protein [Bacteroides sp.]